MKFGIAILFACSMAMPKDKCQPFNFKYHFCYESWLEDEVAKNAFVQVFDELKYKTDIRLTTGSRDGKMVFAFEFHNQEFLDAMSELPGKEYDQDMERRLIVLYGVPLTQAPKAYIAEKVTAKFGDKPDKKKSMAFIKEDPELSPLVSGKYFLLLNFYDAKGQLMKTYDVQDYVKKSRTDSESADDKEGDSTD